MSVKSSVPTALFCLALAAAAPALADGARVYDEACAACHMPQGEGIEGAFPALKDNAIVLGDEDALADLLLEGRGGMPTFAGDLDDQALSEVLTFIRGAWGNAGSPLSTETVKAARDRHKPEEGEGPGAH